MYVEHEYGPQVNILHNPYLNTVLTRFSGSERKLPEITQDVV
jgi:DNA-directed RNA polymerase subunit H (RpoH/RPB5)